MKIVDVIWRKPVSTYAISACDALAVSVNSVYSGDGYNIMLTLRREVGVKLTPDPINCLIFKDGFNLYRRDFATFNIYSLPSIWHT